tara:strand:- start:286 stop:489 length:204 start_codon:yes stop_codon:yes gene_type:complete
VSLSDREKFIVHFCVNLLALDNHQEFEKALDHSIKHRCRKLPAEAIMSIAKDIHEEIMLSRVIWNED